MATKFLPFGAYGLWVVGLVIGIPGSRFLHSKLLFNVGIYLIATATLLLGVFYAIGNTPRKRWIGGVIAIWSGLFAVWLLIPALHRTPLLHYGTGIIWLCGLGVLTYILWRIDRLEKSANASSPSATRA